jgi:hypothetical protein
MRDLIILTRFTSIRSSSKVIEYIFKYLAKYLKYLGYIWNFYPSEKVNRRPILRCVMNSSLSTKSLASDGAVVFKTKSDHSPQKLTYI